MLDEIEEMGRRVDAAIEMRYAQPLHALLKDVRKLLVAAHAHIKALSS